MQLMLSYAVSGVYDHTKCGTGEVLDKLPRLRAVYRGAWRVGKLSDFKREWLYFTADPEHLSFLSDSEATEAKAEEKPKFPPEKPVLVYWAASSSGDTAKCLLFAGSIDYDLNTEDANALPAYKDRCPFG
jgi:hypothetical protein